MSTGTTALMPLDPAVSPEQANRILPIRTNLLPDEITAGRNARRIRLLLIAAVVLAVVVMGGWYVYAIKQRNHALDDANAVNDQVATVRKQTTTKEFKAVTDAIKQTETLKADLKSTMTGDLPWDTLLDQLRSTATAKEVTISAVVTTMTLDDKAGAATGKQTIGNLQITGSAKDKKTIADFVDAVSKIKSGSVTPLTNAYLTSATQQQTWVFTMTADITADTACGRFTTTCKSGGY
ncbi:hypothetical protein ACQP2F_05625 [Actinoplanes sp. CA-030573]|uniref:hypothetical protein n=1 Tax=Actinoplanes sp. CA-030573 TaxID=3239898 RepID=UPI003D9249BA